MNDDDTLEVDVSNDHPGLPFVQAAGYTHGRPDGPPLWIVVHDMEASEHSARAESTAAYFANPGDGRSVSSHYCVDDNSVIQCVDLDDVAWTVGNRPGNNRGINWELSGFARQSRAEWLDQFGRAMFAQMAPIVRKDAARFGIPLRQCSIDDLRAFRKGVTSHNDLRLAFGVTDHTDPGPNFPWDVFLAVLNQQEEDDTMGAFLNKDTTGQVWLNTAMMFRRKIDADMVATVKYYYSDILKEPLTDLTNSHPIDLDRYGNAMGVDVTHLATPGAVDVAELAEQLAPMLPAPLTFEQTKQASFEGSQQAENQ